MGISLLTLVQLDANTNAFPGFVEACVRPLFSEGKGPFRWLALSGDPEDSYKTDARVREVMTDAGLAPPCWYKIDTVVT